MTEIIASLLIIAVWLGYKGYITLVDYLLEKVIMLIQVTMITTGILGVFR